MPKRVIDFDALWASDKLASCAEWAQSEYAWLYGLADASGSFEFTNLRVIWGRVAAIRKNLSLERLQEIFDEFIARGLLFTWEENGKRYGHWTGSDVPGRLPPRSWRVRLQKLAPPVPAEALAEYSARFGGSKEGIVLRAGSAAGACDGEPEDVPERDLKDDVEEAQAQDWDLGSEGDLDLEKQVCLAPQDEQSRLISGTPYLAPQQMRPRFNARALACVEGRLLGAPPELQARPKTPRQSHSCGWGARKTVTTEPPPCSAGLQPGTMAREDADAALKGGATVGALAQIEDGDRPPGCRAEELLAIYEGERGVLPAAGVLTAERRRRCTRWLAGGFTAEEFRAAVRCAAATPFLAGDGNRRWRADFDWLIANRTNARKVLAGQYAPRTSARAASEQARTGRSRAARHVPADLYTGIGPRPADCGVRVNPAALERIRARQAQARASPALLKS